MRQENATNGEFDGRNVKVVGCCSVIRFVTVNNSVEYYVNINDAAYGDRIVESESSIIRP